MTEQFTEKQARAWERDVAPILERHGVSKAPPGQLFGHWMVDWAEEVRPGRGHDVNAIYVDGDVAVQVLLDVYGRANVSVAELDWVHADSDEELRCQTCFDEWECLERPGGKHELEYVGRSVKGRGPTYACKHCDFGIHHDVWKKTRVENVPDPRGLLSGPLYDLALQQMFERAKEIEGRTA